MNKIKLLPAFKDNRGLIWDLLGGEQIDHIGMLTTKKGSIRGKHFHKLQKQYTLLFEGKIKVKVKNLQDEKSTIQEFILNPMEMILFPPYHYHSLEAIEDSICLIFTDRSRVSGGYEKDTIRVNDIENYNIF